MANLQALDGCCGVVELSGVSDDAPEYILEECNCEISSRNVVFTDIAKHKRLKDSGWKFAAFVLKNGLGAITGPSPAGVNPNTKNKVHVWIWTPNVKALQKWLDKQQARREKEDAEY